MLAKFTRGGEFYAITRRIGRNEVKAAQRSQLGKRRYGETICVFEPFCKKADKSDKVICNLDHDKLGQKGANRPNRANQENLSQTARKQMGFDLGREYTNRPVRPKWEISALCQMGQRDSPGREAGRE
ncbi:hypothetical protein KI387_041477, partial [Taxus chinensis]